MTETYVPIPEPKMSLLPTDKMVKGEQKTPNEACTASSSEIAQASAETSQRGPTELVGCGTMIAFAGPMKCGKDTASELLSEACESLWPEVKFVEMRFAGKVRECIDTLTRGVVPIHKTYSSGDKSAFLPAGSLGSTLGELKARVMAAIMRALGMSAAAIVDLEDGKTEPELRTKSFAKIDDDTLLKAASIISGTSFSHGDSDTTPITIDKSITVGRLLQLLGTDVGRELIDPDIWVHALERDWKELGRPPVKIPDLRFPNEHLFIEKYKGLSFLIDAEERLQRGKEKTSSDGRVVGHASETMLSAIPRDKFTGVISNNGTLEDFRKLIYDVVAPNIKPARRN